MVDGRRGWAREEWDWTGRDGTPSRSVSESKTKLLNYASCTMPRFICNCNSVAFESDFKTVLFSFPSHTYFL